jgi:hypothetical protein
MKQEDADRIAAAILGTIGVRGFALVVGMGDQTIVLLNNVCADAAGDILVKASRDIAEGAQRPALFN